MNIISRAFQKNTAEPPTSGYARPHWGQLAMPRGSKRGRAAKKYKTHIIRGITCLSALDRTLDRACENGLHLRGARDRKPSPAWLAAIAHDLNNLFMIVSGNVDLLRYEVQSEKAGRLLDTIERMTQRGRGLTEQLLSFARSRAVDPDVTDIGKAVEELSGTLKHCLRRDIGIEVQVPDAPCFVTIDRGEFELAALNLAVNARDAMPKGGMFRIIVTPQGRQPQRKSAARSICPWRGSR